jgi:hypothetical protein
MHPKLVGNPLMAWREETVLQVGWGTHAVVIESAHDELPTWLRLANGSRSRARLLDEAEQLGILREQATSALDRLSSVDLVEAHTTTRSVAVHPCGVLGEPLTKALRDTGLEVRKQADVVVYAQGQLPSLVNAPQRVHRLIPVWFEAHATHVGPVLDHTRGPCPRCIDRAWAQLDPAWPTLVAQATTVATWHDPAQVLQAATAICLIAHDPSTVGLEMIFDPAKPGPMWRVWSVHPDCTCRLGPPNLARVRADVGKQRLKTSP